MKTYEFTFAGTITGSQQVIAANKEEAATAAEEHMRAKNYCNWQILALGNLVRRENLKIGLQFLSKMQDRFLR